MLGPQDVMVIAAVGYILFGSKKLPDVARSLGTSIVEFKKAMNAVNPTSEMMAAPPATAPVPATAPLAAEAPVPAEAPLIAVAPLAAAAPVPAVVPHEISSTRIPPASN